MAVETRLQAHSGDILIDTHGRGLSYGHLIPLDFPPVATLADGVAITTIQQYRAVPFYHRLRKITARHLTHTAVAPGTDPAVDVRRYLPVPPAPTVALATPAAAGNIENGAHFYAVTYVNAAGESLPSPVASVTVVNNTINGKVDITIPIGPTGTTQRKVYRSAAAGTALLLQQTVANNTATTATIDNTADSGLGAGVVTANAAMATVLGATLKLSLALATGADQTLVQQSLTATLAADVETTIWPPCEYDVRALTGASTGALAGLQVTLWVEALPG